MKPEDSENLTKILKHDKQTSFMKGSVKKKWVYKYIFK